MAQHTITIQCIKDTYVSSNNPNTNYGGATQLLVGGDPDIKYFFMNFPLSGIPSRKRIISAILHIYLNSYQDGNFLEANVFGSNNIAESQITYSNQPYSRVYTKWPGIDMGSYSGLSNVFVTADLTTGISGAYGAGESDTWVRISYANLNTITSSFASRESGNIEYLEITYEDVPPDAPTPTDPIGDYKDNKSVIRFEWQYNSSVGGTQKAFDLQWSTDQSTWTTVSQTTANNYYDMPANTLPSGNIYWRVRCYNEYDEVGPYCDIQSFYAIGAPATPILNAIPTNSARPVISWTAFSQQVYQLQVLQGDTVTYDSGNQPSITARQHKVMAFLADGTYTAKLRIKNEYDLWSAWGEATFTVSTAKPAKPTLTAQPTAYGIELYITGMAYYALMYRSDYGADNYKCIGKTTATTYIDNSVRNKAEYQYYVRSVDEMASDVETYEDSDIQFIQAEIKNSLIAPVSDMTNVFAFTRSLNSPPKRVLDRAPGGAYVQYDGRTYPVWEPSEHISSGLSLAFFLRTWTEAESFIALYDRKETVLYRDAKGRKVYGAMSGLQVTEDRAGYIVSFVINQVDYDEKIEV